MANPTRRPEDQWSSPGAESPQADPGGGTSPGHDRQGAPPNQPPTQVQVDDSRAVVAYANFCRVTMTPEELVIDFGFNHQPHGASGQTMAVTQRIITNYYAAKRMLHALGLAVRRHEEVFGVLETDARKRIKPGAEGLFRPPADA